MIDYQISIDFQHPAMIRVPVVQGDTESRTITFSLQNDAADYDPQTDLDATLTVALSYLKPDGTGGQYDTMPDGTTPAGNLSGSTCLLRLAPQTMSAAGLVLCNLVLFDTQGVTLQSYPFMLDVKRSAGMEITSEDYYNVQTIEGVSQALLNLMALRLATADVPSRADTSGEIPLSAIWPRSAVKAGDIVLGQNYYVAVVASVSGQTVALSGTSMVFTPAGMVKSVNNAQPDAAGNVQLLPWLLPYSNTIGGQQVADVEEALDRLTTIVNNLSGN